MRRVGQTAVQSASVHHNHIACIALHRHAVFLLATSGASKLRDNVLGRVLVCDLFVAQLHCGRCCAGQELCGSELWAGGVEWDEHGDEVARQTRLMCAVGADYTQLLLSEEVRGVDVPVLGAGAWV